MEELSRGEKGDGVWVFSDPRLCGAEGGGADWGAECTGLNREGGGRGEGFVGVRDWQMFSKVLHLWLGFL